MMMMMMIIIIILAHQHKAAGRKTRLYIQNYVLIKFHQNNQKVIYF